MRRERRPAGWAPPSCSLLLPAVAAAAGADAAADRGERIGAVEATGIADRDPKVVEERRENRAWPRARTWSTATGRSPTSPTARRWRWSSSTRRAARCASRGPATRWPGRWPAATRAPSATSSTRPTSSCRSARSSCSAWSTGAGPGGSPTSTCSSCSASASPTSSSTGPRSASRCRSVYPVLLYLLGRALWIGFRGRGEGLRPVWPAAWLLVAALFLMGFRVGLNVADSGAIDVGYAERRRRRPHHPRRTDLRQLPRRRLPGRHLRPGQLLRLRPLRADLALVGQLGRPAGRPRRRGHLRPRHLRPADPARPPHPPRTGRPPPRRDPRLRLGRLPLHRLRPRVELQRHAGRDAPGRDPAGPRATGRPRRAGGARDLRRSSPRRCSPRCCYLRPTAGGARRPSDALARRPPLVSPASALRPGLRTAALVMLWPAIDPGLHTFYDRTIAYQAGRDSPFSIWGQVAGAGAAAHRDPRRHRRPSRSLFAFRPRDKSLAQVAALGAALLIGVQLTAAALVLPLHRLVLPAAPGRDGDAGERASGSAEPEPSPARTSPPAPAALTSTTAPITQTSSSAVSNRVGICVISEASACSGLTPSTLVREPVMPTSEMKAVPPRQHPAVGGRHVGVGAEDRGDAAVEVPAHRHLLAGHLGVEVDDDASASIRSRIPSTVSKGERATLQADRAAEVDHADPHARRPRPRCGRARGCPCG